MVESQGLTPNILVLASAPHPVCGIPPGSGGCVWPDCYSYRERETIGDVWQGGRLSHGSSSLPL